MYYPFRYEEEIVMNPELAERLKNLKKSNESEQQFQQMIPEGLRPLFKNFVARRDDNNALSPEAERMNELIASLSMQENPGAAILSGIAELSQNDEENAAKFYDALRKIQGLEEINADNAEKMQRLNAEIFQNAQVLQELENKINSLFNEHREELKTQNWQTPGQHFMDKMHSGLSAKAGHAWYDNSKTIGATVFVMLELLLDVLSNLAKHGELKKSHPKGNDNSQRLIPMKM